MNLLVTGGAGFIGSNFVHHWNSTHPKDNITVLDNLTYAGHVENLKDVFDNKNFRFIKGDIRSETDVETAMEGTDVVVHFAAESHVDRSIVKPDDFITTNINGTQVLLQAARKQEVRLFHHVSTDEVFGSLSLNNPEVKFNEETPYNPHSPYSASKASSDHLVRAYHETYGLPVTITNTSNNYGPYQDPEKLIPRFTTNLLQDQKVPLMGEGENVRDWIHVVDHCRAIGMIVDAAVRDSSIIGETFCVGGNSERTNKQVTLALLAALGKDESYIERVPHRLGHDARYAIDSTKIGKVLGWKPEHEFEGWIKETVKWYEQNQWWWEPLKEGRPNIDPELQQRALRVNNGRERM